MRSAAGDVGGLGYASIRYMICVKVKKLTPSGSGQFAAAKWGPCNNGIALKTRSGRLQTRRSEMFAITPTQSRTLRWRGSRWRHIARAIAQLNRIDPRRSGQLDGLGS